MILLRTIHGSHLYGLNHSNSDIDYYTVVTNKDNRRKATYAKQTILDGVDSTVIDLSTFMKQVHAGVPQALEALFSQKAEVDVLTHLRKSYRIDTARAVVTYRRTIKNFSFEDEKHRRHAVRLCFNLEELIQTGRFNPTLNPTQIEMVYRLAAAEDFQDHLMTCIGE